MGKKKPMGMPDYKSGAQYGQQFMVKGSKELKDATGQHQQHHYPESRLDSKTVLYSVMDDKHKGRR